MASVFDAANFFIEAAASQEDCVTNLKLNKLLYFAQALSLVKNGKSLFEDDIEAWPMGPVVDQIYHKYKGHGRNHIKAVDNADYYLGLTDEEQDILVDVMTSLGRYTASSLVTLSHVRGGPWDTALNSGIISKQSIKAYYSMQPEIFESFNADNFCTQIVIPKRSSSGVALLSKEELDDWE